MLGESQGAIPSRYPQIGVEHYSRHLIAHQHRSWSSPPFGIFPWRCLLSTLACTSNRTTLWVAAGREREGERPAALGWTMQVQWLPSWCPFNQLFQIALSGQNSITTRDWHLLRQFIYEMSCLFPGPTLRDLLSIVKWSLFVWQKSLFRLSSASSPWYPITADNLVNCGLLKHAVQPLNSIKLECLHLMMLTRLTMTGGTWSKSRKIPVY